MAVAWNFSVVNLENKTLVSGTLLNATPFSFNKKTSKLRNALLLLKTYLIPVVRNTKFIISYQGKEIPCLTNNKGGFSLELDTPMLEVPIIRHLNKETIEVINIGAVVFDYRSTEFNIISDFDDTLMVSYTANVLKRVKAMTFSLPSRRKPIEFTHKIVSALKQQNSGILYLSKSENNLFGMLTSFLNHYNLPPGVLFLSPYLKLAQLLNPKKDKDYKINVIRFFFENTNQKKFVLFGDDSQRDMDIYTTVANEYPRRILKIYIRKTKTSSNTRQKAQWQKLIQTGVPAKYFKTNDDFTSELILLNH